MTEQKTAVVTGASTGIGRAIAQSLVDAGWHVFGSVRKEKDASALQNDLGERFTPLIFDVTDNDAILRGAEIVREKLNGRTLGGLVNNAGIAVAGPLRYIAIDELQHQMNVNLYGVLRVTQAFLPMLGADKSFTGAPGRIVNMSSVAGKIASPIMGPYSMSKHALEAFSDSLRRELMMHGVDVVVIGPGAVKTPIWDKADEIDAEKYKDTEYYDVLIGMREKYKAVGQEGLPPEDIGALARNVLEGTARKTRYAVVRDKLLMWTLPRLMPKRTVDKIIARRFGFPEKAQ